MPSKDKYTDPKLREEVKEEVQNGDKGGAPGQWSARKAQFMAQEYKKRGGGYTTDKGNKDESQQHLDNWGEEDWQTKEGSGQAKRDDGTEKRYLPKKAWEGMTEEEKEETEQKKLEEGKQGKQYVGNTDKAKQSRKKASKSAGGDKQNGSKKNGGRKQDDGDDGQGEQGQDDADAEEDDSEEEYVDDGQADADNDGDVDMEDEKAEADDEEQDDEHDDKESAQTGQKRKSGKQQNANRQSKKQKGASGNGKPKETVGSKHMDATEPAPRGSKDELPKKGQHATWKAMPGYVEGEVVDILTADQDVEGKATKASEDNPKIVLKSDASGKICVHKPDSCYYYI